MENRHTDVLIVGSGPVGATYARKLVESGHEVLMVEVGTQESPVPGEHKKNSITFQKDVNQFVKYVKNIGQADLFTLSVPVAEELFPTLDPVSVPGIASISNGQNPKQNPKWNIDAKATRCVGGMSTHWTCCTPEMAPGIELPDLFDEPTWKGLYAEAKELIHTSTTQFEDSIHQQLVKRHLQDVFNAEGISREFKAMPLACKRRQDNPQYVTWSSSATVFDHITKTPHRDGSPLFTLLDEHQCVRVIRDEFVGEIRGAEIKNLRTNQKIFVQAKRYVICAGAVLTPQILFKSGFNTKSHPALGHWMTEQVMTFCQIVMKKELLDLVRTDHWNLGWKKIVEEHEMKHPRDPLPFPFKDPDPQVTTPVTSKYPWHTQIHRDAFSYGLVPDIYDQRTIVDLRWFGYVKPVKENRVEFSSTDTDLYGMPQPTFYFRLGEEDAKRANAQMNDMINVATKLGGFLPGALPQFLPPGAALHVCGTTRAGKHISNSMVDKDSRVHGSKNLFLGGCNGAKTIAEDLAQGE